LKVSRGKRSSVGFGVVEVERCGWPLRRKGPPSQLLGPVLRGHLKRGGLDESKILFSFLISACAIQVTDVQASLYVYVYTGMMNDTLSLRVKKREGAELIGKVKLMSHDHITCTAKEIAPDPSSTSKQTKHISKYLMPSRLGSQVPRNIRSGLSAHQLAQH
jgi:hypothetical protein